MKKTIILLFIILFITAKGFPQNKIRWKDMDWRIYETEHFDIYYYRGEDFLAKMAAIYAEQGLENDSQTLKYHPKARIPLFIYEDSQDFGTTNITLSYLGGNVGGFTEPYKNRVVIPGGGSLLSLKQVIFHEITHAIQYDILFGEGMRSYNMVYKTIAVPLWVMEGMAEYDADDYGTIGDMMLREAVTSEKLITLDKLDGFDHLEEPYLAYKESQSIFMYIDKFYGKDKIAKIINFFKDENSIEAVIKKVLKKEYPDFQKEWQFYMKKKYWAQIQGRDTPDKYGPKLTNNNRQNIVYNQGPAFSPNGETIAFVSTKDGHSEIFLMRKDGQDVRKAFRYVLEGVDSSGCPISWGSDNRTLYFSAVDRGRTYLCRGDIESGKIDKLETPDIPYVFSPAISPDNKFLAFIGVKNGFSDVYVYDIEKKKVTNITDNLFANDYVSWSKDGGSLLFTEERDDFFRLATIDLKSGVKKFITKPAKYDYKCPAFISDEEIAFTSDKNGIFNLYKMDVKTGEEQQLTNITNGIFNVCPVGNYIAYSYYEDGCYNIYKYLIDRERAFAEIPLTYIPPSEEKAKPNALSNTAAQAPQTEISASFTGDDGDMKNQIEKQAENIITKDSKYDTAFSIDLIFAIFGFSSDAGPVGTGYVFTSDMLGNHDIQLTADFIPGYFSQFDLTYYYLSLPFDLGLDLFYDQNVYELYDPLRGVFFSELNQTQEGGTVSMQYPFNLYTSLKVSLSEKIVTDIYNNYDIESSYFFGTNFSGPLNVISALFAYDYSAWRDFWPYSGEAVMAYVESAEKIFGGQQTYNLYDIDLRKYFDLSFITNNNLSLGLRLAGALTDGPDKPLFFFGGEGTVRGLDYGQFYGDKYAVFNSELRFTVAKSIDFVLWPLTAYMIKNIKIAFFDDAGIVEQGMVDYVAPEDVKNGVGISLIFDTFLLQREFIPLTFEVAKRTDITSNNYNFYFSINTAF